MQITLSSGWFNIKFWLVLDMVQVLHYYGLDIWIHWVKFGYKRQTFLACSTLGSCFNAHFCCQNLFQPDLLVIKVSVFFKNRFNFTCRVIVLPPEFTLPLILDLFPFKPHYYFGMTKQRCKLASGLVFQKMCEHLNFLITNCGKIVYDSFILLTWNAGWLFPMTKPSLQSLCLVNYKSVAIIFFLFNLTVICNYRVKFEKLSPWKTTLEDDVGE